MKNDMNFIAGNYMHGDLPIEKEYLHHYFDSRLEKAFASYYFMFSHLKKEGFLPFYNSFCDHTGCSCTGRWVKKLFERITRIEKELKEAEQNFDLDRVGEIKSGKASLRFR